MLMHRRVDELVSLQVPAFVVGLFCLVLDYKDKTLQFPLPDLGRGKNGMIDGGSVHF